MKSLKELMAEINATQVNEGLSPADEKKAEAIKKSMMGYVGADFAKKATNEDIIAMADLKDELAQIHNTKIKPVNDKINKLRKKYKLKPA